MDEIRGVLHAPDGRTVRVAVEWRIGSRTFAVRGDGVALDVAAADVTTRSGGWRGDVLHLVWETPDGPHAVTIDREEGLAALEQRATPAIAEAARAARTGGRRSKGRLRLAVGLVTAIVALPFVALALLIFHPDPLLGFVVARLPTSVDERIGALAKEQTEATAEIVADGPAVDAVETIARRLLAHAPEHPFRFELTVVRDETVNAFAAPGGYVVVHTGLLENAESAEEVAGVVAHELAHVLERHSVRQLARRLGFWAVLSATVGSVEGFGGVLVEGAASLADLDYSRDQERAADDLGFEMLRAVSLPTDGLATFFDRLAADQPGVPAFLSTHPGSEERAERLREHRARDGPVDVRPLDVDWKEVRASLR